MCFSNALDDVDNDKSIKKNCGNGKVSHVIFSNSLIIFLCRKIMINLKNTFNYIRFTCGCMQHKDAYCKYLQPS